MSATAAPRPVLLLTPDQDAAIRRLSEGTDDTTGGADDALLATARVRLRAASNEDLVDRWRRLQDFAAPDPTPSSTVTTMRRDHHV